MTLTGTTGFVEYKLTELQEHDHEVTTLVRDDAQSERTPQ
jgi:NAD dependent epimerase/dehydratase family enzyme